MQLKVLPSGFQMQIMGNVINVRMYISQGVNSLPQYLNSEWTVVVCIKRK